MRVAGWFIAFSFALPLPAAAQGPVFTQLLNGAVSFRAPLPWTAVRAVRLPDSEGVLLEYREDRDTALTLAVFAYVVPRYRSLEQWSDSVLARALPTDSAERISDSVTTTARSTLWKDGSLLAMDRFERTAEGVLWVRAMMWTSPQPATTIRARMQAIDDLMTTIRTDRGLLFPDGSRLGIIVY